MGWSRKGELAARTETAEAETAEVGTEGEAAVAIGTGTVAEAGDAADGTVAAGTEIGTAIGDGGPDARPIPRRRTRSEN